MLTDLVLEYNKANPREELDIVIFNSVVDSTLTFAKKTFGEEIVELVVTNRLT